LELDFSAEDFHPVIHLPPEVDVLELGWPEADRPPRQSAYSIGRYNERRVIYRQPLFSGSRDIHMGLDIGGPVGTPVHAFADGAIAFFGYNGAEGDYGHTLITVHRIAGVDLWALHGHLDARSTRDHTSGAPIRKGEVIAWIGDHHENGGWPPHLHFQLSRREPTTFDLPGVVSEAERSQALVDYPDPRLVLGPLY
jgi:murein DD-endopeptidase MepM/ murein hydrolase activator NlpD